MLKKLFNILFGTGSKSVAKGSDNDNGIRDLEGFVSYVVCSLVDYPDEVNIQTEKTEEGCTIKVRCRKEDIGKVVGKRGKTIMAIRSLVSGAAGRQRRRVSVEILD